MPLPVIPYPDGLRAERLYSKDSPTRHREDEKFYRDAQAGVDPDSAVSATHDKKLSGAEGELIPVMCATIHFPLTPILANN